MNAKTALTISFALACTACGGGGGSGPGPGTVTSGGGGAVVAAPVISTQPASQSIASGKPATFSVAASGAAAYQWRRDGSPIAGATGASYTVPAVQLEDRGSKWSVQVSNQGGTVTSSDAVLTVSGIRLLAGAPDTAGSADGAGAAARFHEPFGLAVDGSGNVFAADYYNQTIRKISPAGLVTTLAGTSELNGQADGTGSAARFAYPTGVALDRAGNLFVADSAWRLVRKVTPQGVVSTVTQLPKGTSVDGQSTGLFQPSGIALDGAGNIYVTNGVGTRRIAPDATYTMIEGDDVRNDVPTSVVATVRGIAVDPSGNVYVGSLQNDIRKLGTAGAAIAGTAGIQGFLATDQQGNVYVADQAGSVVRKITPEGKMSIIAGNGSPGHQIGADLGAALPPPRGIAVGSDGVLYVAAGHAIVKIYQP
ncbi:hypothetical protein [Pseudoduganella sp. GCM10020061]|uniref:hypothetical protein n=1 Tax=Pseudoduganella sp. GCM10020061 TaxID=3317345 RepID=UPI00363D5834